MEKKKYWPLTLAAFGGGCLLMAAVYFCLGWWPFGTGTMLTGDLRGLYVNYITDMWARVKQGGFFYSFGKLAGGSTLGLFAYYMNSPFNLLFLLLPTRMVPQAAGLIFLLRTGVTAAAFCWYLQRHFAKADPLFAVLGQCYAFCAFCIVYNQNIIWMDVVWLLPLVLAALDDLMRQGRHWGFTVLVFLCILLNFYIAWPVCLFSILYFLCLWPSQGQGRFGRRFAAFAASGVLAAGLSFFFLLPVLLEVQESKGGLFDFTFSLTPQFNLLQLPYRLFFGNFFWNDVTNGLPNIYCGVVLVPLVLLYFCGNAPRREKLGFAALLAALVNPAFVHQGVTILTYLPSGNPLTLESILYGLAAALLLASVVLWFRCFSTVMTSDKFIYLFGRVIPALSLVLSMTLRFVPRFRRQFRAVSQAQRYMGRDTASGGLIQRGKNAMKVFSVLVTWSLESAIDTADSMRSRGYGQPGRTAFSIYRLDDRDRSLLLWLGFCGLYLLVGALSRGLYFQYYPLLLGAPAQPLTISFFAVYLLLCLTPAAMSWASRRRFRRMKGGA
mgnify:CR=1 FL=1